MSTQRTVIFSEENSRGRVAERSAHSSMPTPIWNLPATPQVLERGAPLSRLATILLIILVIASALLVSQWANAQEQPVVNLDPPETKSPDHYGLAFRLGFNIHADFLHSGAFAPQGHVVPIPGRGLQAQ